jgi:hypothetical protein
MTRFPIRKFLISKVVRAVAVLVAYLLFPDEIGF